jgi:hypothetical protein
LHGRFDFGICETGEDQLGQSLVLVG